MRTQKKIINSSSNNIVERPMLDPRARETSFKERAIIKKSYSKLLGMNYIDHFSINVVPENKKMLVFSIRPEIAYTVYSSRRGIEQDLAISPTFYNNLDFYFWDDCYNDKSKREIITKKEVNFGIKAGAVIVHKHKGLKYLLSFGTTSHEDNFRHDILWDRKYYKDIAINCLSEISSVVDKYLLPSQLGGNNVYNIKNSKING